MVMIDQVTAAPYDGTVPFTVSGRPPGTVQGRARAGVTIAFVVVPFSRGGAPALTVPGSWLVPAGESGDLGRVCAAG
jgi:hypothetical protein